MAIAQKYHIDLLADRVVGCRLPVGSCEFGGLDTHFYDEDRAQGKLRSWRELNGEWLAKTAYPQEEGWVTEHIFDPKRPESYEGHHVFFGYDIPEGTRLVIENGWIFTKLSFDDFWNMDSGYEAVGGIKNGQPLKYYEFLQALEDFGGRLEYAEGIKPSPKLRLQELKDVPVKSYFETYPAAVAQKPTGLFGKLFSRR